MVFRVPLMDEELFFRSLFIAIYVLFFSVRIRYRVESARREPEKRQKIELWPFGILVFAILGYFVCVILYMINSPWISWLRLALPLWIRLLGALGAIFSTIVVTWTHRELGRQYSAEFAIQKEHILITTGPYAKTRHPMYSALNGFSLSMALMASNILVILFAALVAVPFPWITREEEQMLIQTFGKEYQDYMKRTGRFFPRIKQTT